MARQMRLEHFPRAQIWRSAASGDHSRSAAARGQHKCGSNIFLAHRSGGALRAGTTRGPPRHVARQMRLEHFPRAQIWRSAASGDHSRSAAARGQTNAARTFSSRTDLAERCEWGPLAVRRGTWPENAARPKTSGWIVQMDVPVTRKLNDELNPATILLGWCCSLVPARWLRVELRTGATR